MYKESPSGAQNDLNWIQKHLKNNFVHREAQKWIKSQYPKEDIYIQRKLESILIGNIVFGIITILYFLTQLRAQMDLSYIFYLSGHLITFLGFFLSMIFLIFKYKNGAVWTLYLCIIGIFLAGILVPFPETYDYFFYMLNFTFTETSILMVYLYLNIVSFQPIHKYLSLIFTFLVSIIVIIVYVQVGDRNTNIYSIFLPVFVGFFVNAILISMLHHRQIYELQKNQEKIQELLKKSKERVDDLESMLPICSNCKKIQTAQEQWIPVEDYIKDESKVEFSHSLCPKCAQELYGEFL